MSRFLRLFLLPASCFLLTLLPSAAHSVSLLPGWPKTTGNNILSSPALGDLDGDGVPEVVVASCDGKVYAWRSNGTLVAGWPQNAQEAHWCSPLVGDLDGDGHVEVVAATLQKAVYAWHGDGALVTGWPQPTSSWINSSPALGDLDGDGDLEVVVGASDALVYVWHHDGSPVAGWPQSTGGWGDWVESSPALGDLDGDGALEVVVGCNSGKVFAWHGDGTPVSGWPRTAMYVRGSPALGDLDKDGRLEVVVGSYDDKVYAWHGDGSVVAGWPQSTGDWVIGSPALGDLDGDGHLEVVAACYDHKVYAWHADGTTVAGWPQATGLPLDGSPALADLDGDGRLEVIVGSFDYNVYAWHDNGVLVTGWPQNAGNSAVHGSPAVGDLNGDGRLEVVVATESGRVYAWCCDTATQDLQPWPMFHHDARHTGLYGTGAPPDAPTNLFPLAGAPVASATPTLQGSLFSDPDVGDVMMASEWQIRAAAGTYASPRWDRVNPGRATGVTVAWGALSEGSTYYWRTRYRDTQEHWGEWSQETSFQTPVGQTTLSSGYVMPASGDTSTRFTYRLKFWNTVNGAPTSVLVGIWSSASKTTSWRPMWELDASDTNAVDGKWYTCSGYLPAGNNAYRFAAQVGGDWIYWPQPAGSYQSGPTVAAPPAVSLTSGYMTPTMGTGATQFTWRIKYWNTENAAPDEVQVAIWFPTLKTTYWSSMYPYDPSDTTYRDGAWHTFTRRWLPPGAYAYRFAARQGANWAYWPVPAGTYASGPTVGP